MRFTFSQAISGYFIYAEVAGLSPHTILDYQNTFNRFLRFMGDVEIDQITNQDVQLNYHTGLSALWAWMVMSIARRF